MTENIPAVLEALDAFRCEKDEDIENFLRSNAVEYLERKWCSIYLILNLDYFEKGKLKIEAYFTLSNKVLITPNISISKIKKVSGFKNADAIHFILIGQLGKYISLKNEKIVESKITGFEILDYAMEIIDEIRKLIPCRCVMVECNNNEKLQNMYKKYGFCYLQFDDKHHQYYLKL